MNSILTLRTVIVFAVWLAVSSCAVQGDGKEVSVEHPANSFAIAQSAADKHCDTFGRAARHVQTLPAASQATTLFLQTRTSVFECVER